MTLLLIISKSFYLDLVKQTSFFVSELARNSHLRRTRFPFLAIFK
jgi:hypothetical protein